MKKILYVSLALLLGTSLLNASHAMSGKGNAENALTESKAFTEKEIDIIKDVFDILAGNETEADDKDHKHGKKNKKKTMPHGLAKRDELPPGLQKHIEKNGTLPPGLEGRELPDELKRKLPKRYDGTETIILGDDVVLIEKATRKVWDIIKGAAKN